MPELPEVETLVQGLRSELIGRVISDVEISKPKMWRGAASIEAHGKRIEAIERIAKLLVFRLSHDLLFIIHLKMTGQLIFVNNAGARVVGGHPDNQFIVKQPSKYTHVTFSFNDGSHLYFNDMRQFGYVQLMNAHDLLKHSFASTVGIDPLTKAFTVDYLYDQMQRRSKTTVKQVLLDQTVIAGIGNIYADESLFDAKILPMRKAADIDRVEVEPLHRSIIKILHKALSLGGTSYKDYVHHTGAKGSMQDHLLVYRRHGKPCEVCGTVISRTVIGGRGTHYCKKCQK